MSATCDGACTILLACYHFPDAVSLAFILQYLAGHHLWVLSDMGQSCAPHRMLSPCRIWNLNNGTCKHVLEGHKARLNTVAIGDDGQLVVTASDDGTARLWDPSTGACKKVLQVGRHRDLDRHGEQDPHWAGWCCSCLATGAQLKFCNSERPG